MLNNWKYFFINKRNWPWLVFQSLLVFVFSKVFELVLKYSHYRDSIQLNDWLFLIDPVNLSLPIFVITYLSIFLGLINLIKAPETFFNALNLFIAQNLIRAYCIYLIPLAPPQGIINLYDPILELTFYNGAEIKTDLFFSGHVSNVFLLALLINNQTLKRLLYIASGLIAIMLLIQRVHYSIDVICAPFVAYLVYKFIGKWLNFYSPKVKATNG